MNRIFPFLSLLFILLFSSFLLAVEVRGIVVDAKTGEPLPGVNVIVKGGVVGAATDEDGYFVFDYDVSQEFTLVFSYIGYKSEEMTISPGQETTSLKVALQEDIFRSEEVVVTGIASRTSKARAEVAVSRIQVSDYTVKNVYNDVSQLLTAKVPGVYLKPASGQVGSGFRFFVRSGGGLNGNEQPVIYVDGVRVNNEEIEASYTGGQGFNTLADLNPEDIEKIEVLKGPAGAATYGTSGSNGVILITTKKGKLLPGRTGGISIRYKSVFGQNRQAHEYTEDEFLSYKDANAIFRDGNIWQQSLSAAGGSNFLRYYASFDRRLEEGIMRNNEMDRKTFRANFDAFPSEKITLSVTGSFSFNELSRPNNDNDIFGYLGNTLLFPTSYFFTDSASVEGYKYKGRNNRFIGSFRVTYSPFKNFEARGSVGVDNADVREDELFPANLPYAFFPAGERYIYNRNVNQFTWDVNARYTYNFTPTLTTTSLVGAQLFDRKVKTSFLASEEFLTELITDIGAGAEVTTYGEGLAHRREAGVFAEQQFSYQDQYYLTLAVRREYASSIGLKAPSIWYPKASLALRLDKYNFFPSQFGLFKVRAAYGETGVLPGPTDPIPLLWTAESSGYGAGAVLSGIGDEKIEPERVKELELGFEAELFTNYSVEFTYYRQTAINSIINFRNAPSTGKTASDVPKNIGKAEGSGVEFLVQASPLKTRNFDLDLTVSGAWQTNEVKDLGGAQPIFDGFDVNVIKEGLPKHEFYSWKVEGPDFDSNGNYIGPKLSADRVALGNPVPKFTGAFSLNFRFLKNFNLYAMAEWATGHKIFNFTKSFAMRLGNVKEWNDLNDQLSKLTPGTAEYNAVAEKMAFMDWHADANFFEDADYLKLREISLSYSFRDLLPKINAEKYIKDVMVGFSLRNWFTTTKYSGADVEVNWNGARSLTRGQDFLTLQQPKSFNFFFSIGL